MFCENCGKKLIRGYQFCMECGTPVPPEEEEKEQPADSAAQGGAENSAAQGANNAAVRSTPSVEPINNGNGTLVFCQTCGMHMQTSTTVCEKCGMPLGGSRPTVNVSNGSVPLVNNNPIENEFGGISGISDEDIGQINDLLGGGGLEAAPQITYSAPSSGGEMAAIGKSTQSEIDELTRQLESFGASTGDMPAIGVQPAPVQMRQPEPKAGEARELQNFAMDPAEAHSQVFTDPTDRSVPIIEGGSMDEDPNADVSLDPYSFVNNVLEGTETAPAAEEIAPAVEEIAPPMQPEDFTPAAEEIAPAVEEIAPPMQPEDFTPAAEEIAPAVEEIAPPMQPEDFTPAVPAAEEIAPAVEEIAPPMQPEDFAEDTEPPVMPEYVPPVMPEYEEPAPVIEDGAPAVAEAADEPASPTAEKAPAPAPAAPDNPIQLARRPRDPNAPPEEDPVLGKLSYCRNCGQDMYEKETVCKNCGAPYRAPKKHDASLDNRLGGGTDDKKKKTLPIIIGSAAVVCAAIVLLIVGTNAKKNKDTLTGSETLSVNASSASSSASASTEPEDSTPSEDAATPDTDDAPSVTEPDEVTPPETAEDPNGMPAVVGPETAESSDPKPDTSEPKPATSTPKPATSTSKPAVSTAPKPNTTTTPRATTTSAKPTQTGTVSAKAASLEKDREKIMDAVEKMAAEVGKIDMLAQNVIYTMENASGNAETARTGYYNRDFAKNIISSIDSGKSAVDAAISSAKPKNSELDSVYSQLSTLQKKYTAYYDFIKSPSGNTSKFTSSCSTYLSDFTSTLSSNFKYTKFTSSYTAYETAESYAAAMSDAIAAANNAVSAFSTLEGKLTELKKDNFDTNAVQTLSKSANSKTYANAAAYAQEVAAYRIMLANPPSDYSNAYSYLKTASDKLNALVGLYNMIQENDRSSFSSESSTSITAARSAISSATKEIS